MLEGRWRAALLALDWRRERRTKAGAAAVNTIFVLRAHRAAAEAAGGRPVPSAHLSALKAQCSALVLWPCARLAYSSRCERPNGLKGDCCSRACPMLGRMLAVRTGSAQAAHKQRTGTKSTGPVSHRSMSVPPATASGPVSRDVQPGVPISR